MKFCAKNTFCAFLATLIVAVFSACSQSQLLSKFSILDNFNVDDSLFVVESVSILPDVSSIAFEWKNASVERQDSEIAPEILGYIVYRFDEKNAKGRAIEDIPFSEFKKIAQVNNALITHFYDTKLTPESTYFYIFATIGANNTISKKSKVFKAQTSFIDPVERVFAFAPRPKTTKLIIAPHPNPSIKSYIIERQNEKGDFVRVGELKNRLDIEFFDENLQDGAEYIYRVAAKDFQGNLSRYCNEVSVRTLNPIPSVRNATASADLPARIELAWDELHGAKYYRIYANTEGLFDIIGTTKNTSYTHEKLEHGAKVSYQIVGVDEFGMEGYMMRKAVVGNTISRPGAPRILEASADDSGAVKIMWEEPRDGRAQSYTLYKKDGGSSRANAYENLNALEFVDKEVKAGVSYTYSVSAVDENGIESIQSQAVVVSR